MEYWVRLNKFIKKFENHAYMRNPEEDEEFFNTWELDMAKALLSDSPDCIVRVAKMILALKYIEDIKIKIE